MLGYEQLLESEKGIGLVSVDIRIMVEALLGIFAGQQICIHCMLDQECFAGTKIGPQRLGQAFHRGGIDQAVSLLAPGEASH